MISSRGRTEAEMTMVESGIDGLMLGKAPTRDEAMAPLQKQLAEIRAEHARRVAPLYERLAAFGSPRHEGEEREKRGLREQISQHDQALRLSERPIIDMLVKIDGCFLHPVYIVDAARNKHSPS